MREQKQLNYTAAVRAFAQMDEDERTKRVQLVFCASLVPPPESAAVLQELLEGIWKSDEEKKEKGLVLVRSALSLLPGQHYCVVDWSLLFASFLWSTTAVLAAPRFITPFWDGVLERELLIPCAADDSYCIWSFAIQALVLSGSAEETPHFQEEPEFLDLFYLSLHTLLFQRGKEATSASLVNNCLSYILKELEKGVVGENVDLQKAIVFLMRKAR